MPITRIVRGPLTGQAVDGNRDQMRLDPKIVPLGWREAGVKAVPGRWTWLLLHYYNEPANEIRLELSVPIEFTRKRGTDTERGTVTRFEPRLFLPPIELTDNTEVEDDDEGDDEIDIPVDRRL